MKVLITGESENPTKMNLRAGKFNVIIDEPEGMGVTAEKPAERMIFKTLLEVASYYCAALQG